MTSTSALPLYGLSEQAGGRPPQTQQLDSMGRLHYRYSTKGDGSPLKPPKRLMAPITRSGAVGVVVATSTAPSLSSGAVDVLVVQGPK